MDAADWDRRWSEGHPWGHDPNPFVVALLQDVTPGSALDLAGGDGRNGRFLADRGWRVTVVDHSTVALERGRALALDAEHRAPAGTLGRGTVRWVRADVVADPLPTGPWDLVLVAYLHGPDMADVVARCAALLAPGGRFLLLGHDRSNLEQGTGGPQDAEVLTDLPTVRAAATAAGLVPLVSEVRERSVEGATRPALDAVLLAARPD